MADNKDKARQSRRKFFSLFFESKQPADTVKMLTADGKLVEIDKEVYERFRSGKSATNKEIYHWMDNPSKKNDKASD